MLVDINWIKDNYMKYNEKYWNCELPIPKFRVTMAKTCWGRASYLINRKTKTLYSFTLSISNYMDSPEDVKLNTLLHEMIHIADYHYHPEHFISRRRYNAHGWEFFIPEAKRINKDGFKISPKVTEAEEKASVLSKEAKARIERKKNEPYFLYVGAVNRTVSIKSGKAYDFTVVKPVGGVPTKASYQLAKELKMREITLIKTTSEKFLFSRGRKSSGVYVTAEDMDKILRESEVVMTAAKLSEAMKDKIDLKNGYSYGY